MTIEFINMVVLELEMIKDEELVDAPDEVREGEKIVGELSPELKKLYTLWKHTGKAAGEIENDLRWGGGFEDDTGRGKVLELNAKAQTINFILWIAIQDDLKLWEDKKGLIIRKGFKVVKFDAPQQHSWFNFGGGHV